MTTTIKQGGSIVNNKTTLAKKARTVLNYICCLSMIATTAMYTYPAVFAGDVTGKDKATAVIGGVLSVVYLITNLVGIIFVIIGFVKLAIAHAQEDGPAQQKAALMIATGIILIIIRFVLQQLKIEDWFNSSLDTRAGGKTT